MIVHNRHLRCPVANKNSSGLEEISDSSGALLECVNSFMNQVFLHLSKPISNLRWVAGLRSSPRA